MIDLSPTQATGEIATLSSAYEIPVVRSYASDTVGALHSRKENPWALKP